MEAVICGLEVQAHTRYTMFRRMKFNRKKLEEEFKKHVERINRVDDLIEPKPGELASIYLEEEFEE
ncbi:MAG: hypothetical protein J7K49_06815 [Thaumarchaeota archaeon]|nr:hypothetical protein [Nitrososphaerota archaeon]